MEIKNDKFCKIIRYFVIFLCFCNGVADGENARIITLTPQTTELAFAAGLAHFIVGVGAKSDFPFQAKKMPVIANYPLLDIETILRLKPTLIITDAAFHFNGLEKLQKQGIGIVEIKLVQLSDILKAIDLLSKLGDQSEFAQKNINEFNHHFQKIKQENRRLQKISVFYQLWSRPLMTMNKTSLIGQVVELCGGKIVFDRLKSPASEVSLEAVLMANPQVIIISQSNEFSPWLQWQYLQAVQKNNIFIISPDILQRFTPRVLNGADILCHDLRLARLRM